MFLMSVRSFAYEEVRNLADIFNGDWYQARIRDESNILILNK